MFSTSLVRLIFCALITLCTLLLVFLPQIAGSKIGKAFILERVNNSLDGKISIENLSLSWFNKQTLKGFLLTDKNQSKIISIEKIETETPLWAFIIHSPSWRDTKITNLNGEIQTYSDTSTNLMRALKKLPPSSIELLVVSKLSIEATESSLKLCPQKTCLHFSTKGSTTQDSLEGSFDVRFSSNQIDDLKWTDLKNTEINAAITNFPVDLIDQMISFNQPKISGLTTSLVGHSISIGISQQLIDNQVNLNITVNSPQMHGIIEGILEGKNFKLKQPSHFAFDIPSQALTAFIPPSLKVAQNTKLQLTFDSLLFNLEPHFNIDQIKGALVLLNNQFDHPSIGSITLNNGNIAFSTPDQQNNSHRLNINLSLDTSAFSFERAAFVVGDIVSLKEPFQIDWHWMPKNISSSSFIVNQFNIPLNKKSVDELNLSLSSSHTIDQVTTPYGMLQLNDLAFELKSTGKGIFTTRSRLKISGSNNHELISELLPSAVTVTQSAVVDINDPHNLNISDAILVLASNELNGQIRGDLLNHKIHLTHAAALTYAMTANAQQSLGQWMKKAWPKLEKTAHLTFRINPTIIDLTNELSLSRLKAKGLFAIDEVELEDPSAELPIMEELEVNWSIDGPKNHFTLNLEGLAYDKMATASSQLTGNIEVSNWIIDQKPNFQSIKAEVNADLTRLPTSVLTVLFINHDLTPVLGPIFDIDFSTVIDLNEQTPGYIDLNLDSESFHLKGLFNINDSLSLFNTAKPAEIRLELKPEAIKFLSDSYAFKIPHAPSSPITITGTLADLSIPLSWNLTDHGKIEADFSTSLIETHSDQWIPFALSGKISSRDFNKDFLFSLTAQSSKNEILHLSGIAKHVFTPENSLNRLSAIGLKVNVKGKNISSGFFQTLFFLKQDSGQQIQALLGDRFDLDADCNLNELSGPLGFTVNGTNGQLNLNGQLKNGTFYLTDPLEAKTKLNERALNFLFSKNTFLLGSAIGSEEFVHLTIDPKDFSCHLFPFTFDSLHVGSGKFDLGKMRFRNDEHLNQVMQLMTKTNEKELFIWFTPIFFSLEKSALTIKRVDFLINKTYPLAIWGELNVLTQDGNFTLGISESALNKTISSNLTDWVQIPFKVKKGKIKIDQKQVWTKLGVQAAKSQAEPTIKLLGHLVDQVITTKAEKTMPKRTTDPFPWETTPQ